MSKNMKWIKKNSMILVLLLTITIAMFQGNTISAQAADASGQCVNISEGIYIICSGDNSKFVVDVYGGRSANGTNIAVYETHGGDNQKFKITKVKNGWYKIEAVQSGKVLDVSGGKKGKGVNIQLWAWNGTDSQLFQFYKAPSGGYYIKNKLGCYLDISGGKAKAGANIHTWNYHGGKSQQWTLKKTTVSNAIDMSKAKKAYPDKSYWNGSYKGKAWQCHGWALSAANKITGTDPLSWKKTYSLNNIKAGDIVRFNKPHSILITSVNGDKITYADCNWYRRNTVKYDQTISKGQLTRKFGSLAYVLVKP